MALGMFRHETSMDVDMLILKVQFRNKDYIKIKVEWFVRGKSLGIKQNIKITNDNFKRLKRVENE